MNDEWTKIRRGKRLKSPLPKVSINLQKLEIDHNQIDARHLRRSGRIIQFATKVTPEFDNYIREIAYQKNYLIVEVLEEMMDIYLKHIKYDERERERERERQKSTKSAKN